MFYNGTCTYKESHIGGTRSNVEIRWEEHEDTQTRFRVQCSSRRLLKGIDEFAFFKF